MAWAAAKADVERIIQIDLGTSGVTITEADATRAIYRATAKVEGILTLNGYTPATVSAATTTGAYFFCDNLILNDAVLQTKLWLVVGSPQANAANIEDLQKRVDADYALLQNNPQAVMVGLTLPTGANISDAASTSKISYDDGGDDEPDRAFSRATVLY